MIIKTQGIVLRTIKYGETSLIVDVFTRKLGLRKYIVSGVRKQKAKYSAGLFQLMSLIDLVAYERPGRNMHRIKEVQSAFPYSNLPYNVKKAAVGIFITEIIQKTIREEEEHPELFDFLYETFCYLDETKAPIGNIPITFLLILTGHLGIEPENNYSATHPIFNQMEGFFQESPPVTHVQYLNPPESTLLSQFMQHSILDCHQIKTTSAKRSVLLDHVLRFYQLHIDRFPTINAHIVLQEVLK